MCCGGGGGGWWCKPILVQTRPLALELDWDQADQKRINWKVSRAFFHFFEKESISNNFCQQAYEINVILINKIFPDME